MNKNKRYILSSNLNLMHSNILWNDLLSKYEVKILDMHELFDSYLKFSDYNLINLYFFQKLNESSLKKRNLICFLNHSLIDLKKQIIKHIFIFLYNKENIFNNIKENHNDKRKFIIDDYLKKLSNKFNLFYPNQY